MVTGRSHELKARKMGLFQTDERRRCTKAQFKRNKEHFEQEIMQSYPSRVKEQRHGAQNENNRSPLSTCSMFFLLLLFWLVL